MLVDAITVAGAVRPAPAEGGPKTMRAGSDTPVLPSTRPGSSPGSSEVLTVADLLDHSAHAFVRVDRVEQVDRGHQRGVLVLGDATHLRLEGTADDHRDVGAAHPAHDRQDLVV